MDNNIKIHFNHTLARINGRERKFALRNHKPVINYDLQRKINLLALVNEYEQSKTQTEYTANIFRQHNLDLLELDGIVSLEKALSAEDAVINEINQTMKNHYHNVFVKMVENYKIYDLVEQLYKPNIQHNGPKLKRQKPITEKHQLRKIVDEFNSMHR